MLGQPSGGKKHLRSGRVWDALTPLMAMDAAMGLPSLGGGGWMVKHILQLQKLGGTTLQAYANLHWLQMDEESFPSVPWNSN